MHTQNEKPKKKKIQNKNQIAKDKSQMQKNTNETNRLFLTINSTREKRKVVQSLIRIRIYLHF